MKGVRVNPTRRTVRAETGLKLGEFDRETQAFGLATTLGLVSATGIAGLTLGGGWGNLQAKYGLPVRQRISADVSLLTGSRRCCRNHLFGIRGGSRDSNVLRQ